jgi:hypothetical protein
MRNVPSTDLRIVGYSKHRMPPNGGVISACDTANVQFSGAFGGDKNAGESNLTVRARCTGR